MRCLLSLSIKIILYTYLDGVFYIADQNLAEILACLEKNADICSMMDY